MTLHHDEIFADTQNMTIPYHQKIKDSTGFSLVEVLVAAGLMSVVALAVFSMVNQSLSNSRDLSDKIEVMSLKDLMTRVLTGGAVCTKILAQVNPKMSFDPANANAEINLNSIPLSAADNAPNLIEVGSNLSNTLRVDSIKVTNFQSTGNTNEYIAEYKIEFTKNGPGIVPKPLTHSTMLYTQDIASGAKEIVACADTQISFLERVYFYSGTGVSTGNIYYCNPDCIWTVPTNAKGPAFITIAGGGASAVGPLALNHGGGGNSGGYLLSAPATITPGSSITIRVGRGGRVQSDTTYILGSPGTESCFGNLYCCSGGGVPTQAAIGRSPSEARTSLYETHGIPGLRSGVNVGASSGISGVTVYPGVAGGGTTGSQGPGRCGLNQIGIGNSGVTTYGSPNVASGHYTGGTTPLGYGSGGSDYSTGRAYTAAGTVQDPVGGAYPPWTIYGVQKVPGNGRDGVVIVDFMR